MTRWKLSKQVKTQDVVAMYLEQRLSTGQISKLVGMSRSGVAKRLRSAGVDPAKGRRWTVDCGFCGAPLELRRCELRQSAEHFCNMACYAATREGEKYRPWRQGQRLARVLVSQYFRLEAGNVVHHVDKDNRNNDLANLWVFASSADHMRHHHGRRVEPIWRGEDAVRDRELARVRVPSEAEDAAAGDGQATGGEVG